MPYPYPSPGSLDCVGTRYYRALLNYLLVSNKSKKCDRVSGDDSGDHSLARMGGSNVAMSSVAAGTFGFMAPEQIYNHKLTEATDLYGLGATLISLLTGTKSTAMDTLINEEGQIHFQHLLPQLSLSFVNWLEKMVQPKARARFTNAATALETLQPIDLIRTPEVKLSQESLEFTTTHLGEKLTQMVTLENSVPKYVYKSLLATQETTRLLQSVC